MRHPRWVDDWMVIRVVGCDGHVSPRQRRDEAGAGRDVVVRGGDVVGSGTVGQRVELYFWPVGGKAR